MHSCRVLSLFLSIQYISFMIFIPSATVNCQAYNYISGLDFDVLVSTSTNLNNTLSLTTVALTIPFTPAGFGPNVVVSNGQKFLQLAIVVPDDPYGCSYTSNDVNRYQGAAVLVVRNRCSSARKALYAAGVNASLVIMMNCPTCIDQTYQLISGVGHITIPLLFIRNIHGQHILSLIASSPSASFPIISMRIMGTSGISPNDFSALRRIASTSSKDALYNAAAQISPFYNRDWTDLLPESANYNVDPCLVRLNAIWCTGSHVSLIDLSFFDFGLSSIAPFGQLSALTHLDLSSSTMPVPVPCSFGNLSSLLFLSLNSIGITSFPSCLSSNGAPLSRSLQYLDIGSNTAIMDDLSHIGHFTQLLLLNLRGIGVTSLVPDFSKMKNIISIDVGLNHFFGQLPDFSSTSATLSLNSFAADSNNLSGSIERIFDNCVQLYTVALDNNMLSGPPPRFFNCSSLSGFSLSHNNLTGPISDAWSNLNGVTIIDLSYNAIDTGSSNAFASMNALTQIYLQHNRITNFGTVGSYLTFNLLPPMIIHADFSYNLLSGAFGDGNLQSQSSLTTLLLSFNMITQLPGDIFTGWSSPNLQVIDFRSNQLSGIFDESGMPPFSLLLFRISNNPSLRGDLLSLNWVQPTTSYSKVNLQQMYACQALQATNGLTLEVDPVFYNYELCVCDAGTYLTPPACPSIPSTINVPISSISSGSSYSLSPSPSSTSDSNISTASVLFTDASYGNNRLVPGMNSVWTIQVESMSPNNTNNTINSNIVNNINSNSNSSGNSSNIVIHDLTNANQVPVRVILINVTFNLDEFTSGYDLLDIFEGDASLLGLRVASFRGNSMLSSSSSSSSSSASSSSTSSPSSSSSSSHDFFHSYSVVVRVLSSSASLHFSTLDKSGAHFTATYTVSYSCPDGYVVSPDTNSCRYKFVVDATLKTLIIAVVAIVSAIIATVCVVIIIFRRSVVIVSASFRFCVMICIALLALTLGTLFYIMSPELGDYVCHLRTWFCALSTSVVLSVLLAKSNRVMKIFSNNKFSSKLAVRDVDVFMTIVGVVSVQLMLLVIFSALSLSSSILETSSSSVSSSVNDGDASAVQWNCSTNTTAFTVWLVAQFAYAAPFLVFGVIIAFKIRDTPSAYNESAHIFHCLLALSFFLIVLVPLNYIVDSNPNALMLLRGLGQPICALTICFCIFAPKLFHIATGRANDKSLVTMSTVGVGVGGGGGVGGGRLGSAARKGSVTNRIIGNSPNKNSSPGEGTRSRRLSSGTHDRDRAETAFSPSLSTSPSPIPAMPTLRPSTPSLSPLNACKSRADAASTASCPSPSATTNRAEQQVEQVMMTNSSEICALHKPAAEAEAVNPEPIANGQLGQSKNISAASQTPASTKRVVIHMAL